MLDRVGNVVGERLDGELARDVLEHAALARARGALGAEELELHGGLDRAVEAHAQQVDVQRVAAHRMARESLTTTGVDCAPSTLRSSTAPACGEGGAQLARLDLERQGLVATAVDDAGDEALAAQAAHRARPSLAAGDGERGALRSGHSGGDGSEEPFRREPDGALRLPSCRRRGVSGPAAVGGLHLVASACRGDAVPAASCAADTGRPVSRPTGGRGGTANDGGSPPRPQEPSGPRAGRRSRCRTARPARVRLREPARLADLLPRRDAATDPRADAPADHAARPALAPRATAAAQASASRTGVPA